MYKLRLALLLLFLSYARGEAANKPDDIKTPTITSVARTQNGKDNASTTAKSKTEKRDSADQTGTPAVQRIKDEPFRPIYQPAQYQQEAAAAVNAAFQPTTVRYVAAETVPQAYYEKALDAAALGGRSGIQYASSAYRGPFNPSYQPLSQSQPQQQQQLHQQQQQQQLPREQQQQRQQQNSYAYAEPDAHYTHESETPQPHQQYQHQQQQQQQQQHYNQQLQQYAQQQLYAYYALQKQQQQSRPQPPPLPPSPPPPQALQRQPHQQHPPQQQVHYIIAIPLSHMRQLQQQLAPAHEAPLAYGQPTPNAHARPLPRPQPLVLLQPLAREQHQPQPLVYQPPLLQYSAADAAPPPPAAHTAYSSQFIPLPANLLFAASAGRLPPADNHLQRSPVFQPLFYGQPQHVRQQQLQQQQQQQHNSNVQLAHPPEEPYAQQQQQPAPYQHIQQQQQQQKQQKQANVVRIGGTKPSTKLISTPSPALEPPVAPAAAAIATATPPHLSPQAAAALSPAASPLVHYNHAYAQPAPAAEQPAGAIANYAPYAQGQYSGLPHATLVKLSAPSALLAPMPHYYALPHHPLAAPKLSAAPSSYIVRANPYAAQEPGAALRLPYFMQAGGIHYGTHLYHPPTPTTSAKAAANGPQQQQQHSVAAGGAGDDSAKIVKYP